jgi:gluconate:H+ symporter, GntP family
MSHTRSIQNTSLLQYIPHMPLIIWMILITIAFGFAGNMDADQIVRLFNTGFGRALGEFTLILLPSFLLASSLSQQQIAPTPFLATVMSPIAGASMVCPDTAYAALSPIAARQKLTVGFGAYSGFKLLYPAGPLIVATGLGINDPSIAFFAAALLAPVWGIGFLWARFVHTPSDDLSTVTHRGTILSALRVFVPFGLIASLLVIGGFVDLSSKPALDFVTKPKGALFIAAIWAILQVERHKRRACLDIAINRTGSLLLVIGAASALGTVLTTVIPLSDLIEIGSSGIIGLIGLFALTIAFKLVQGSSMATFAAIAPVTVPIVVGANLSPIAAVLTICLGSFVAILPNDSFYWLVRRDALKDVPSERQSIFILSVGTILQALTGFLIVLILTLMGVF